MIKGVNRQIVEVNDTGSPYFEKIFFILSANAAEKSSGAVQGEMRKLLDTYDLKTPVRVTGRKGRAKRALKLLGAAAAGACAAMIIPPLF